MEIDYTHKPARMALDLVTHSEVIINRSTDLVWPYIVEPNNWKQGLASMHYAGEPGQVGEILAAVDKNKPQQPVFFIKNVEIIPNRRRTTKLYDIDGGLLLGYAIWSLNERNGRTTIIYDVYCQNLLTTEQSAELTQEKLTALEQAGYENNKNRFDKELKLLKKIVESKPVDFF